ncbi:vpu protein [Human immunodeficiency virus 1]|uniref:Vpu protein n=1 Tax=Human immunodeficiency virus type 1 TaxID=11676 RepID=Q8UTD7_HV1|nr:vpu protein [Human immunodeficiency virus 1]
MINLLERVD